ncbi:DUF1007 family protein [Pseudahrensia aquimaris]|uniref:DUF1007 family protein n=1 Tax=Pseudahrensia aquimaris TaxID=744461 RepID=A0ABW3FCQ7_9HYPH
MTLRNATVLFASLWLCLAATFSARAHPHEFVEMKIGIVFDKAGKAAAMRYWWRFDEFFSAFALETAPTGADGQPTQAGIDAVLVEILGNIHGNAYFTRFDENAGPVPPMAKANAGDAVFENRQLTVSFTVPFKEPFALAGKKFAYAIYDKDFYIAMNHSTDADAIEMVGAPKGCEAKIDAADPSEDIASFAASLGRDESAEGDLGIHFAEWVTVSCP